MNRKRMALVAIRLQQERDQKFATISMWRSRSAIESAKTGEQWIGPPFA